MFTICFKSLDTSDGACGKLPHLLVLRFKANRHSLLEPGVAVLVVDVEEREGEEQEGKHQGQASRWEGNNFRNEKRILPITPCHMS